MRRRLEAQSADRLKRPLLYHWATPLWREFLVVACPWPSQRTRGRICRAGAAVGREDEVPDTLGNRVSGGGAVSEESFGARERAFAPPLVIFAQLGLVFFHLGLEFAEGFLATGPHGCAAAGGMQRSGWQR